MKKKRSRFYYFLEEKINKKQIYSINEAIDFLRENYNKNSNYRISFSINFRDKFKQPIKRKIIIPNSFNEKKVAVIEENMDRSSFSSNLEKKIFFFGLTEISKIIEKKKVKKWPFSKLIITNDFREKIDFMKNILVRNKFYPSEKNNCLVNDLNEVKKEIESFDPKEINFFSDKFGNISLNIGNNNLEKREIEENYIKLFKELNEIKPNGWNGPFINKIILSANNSPGLKLSYL